jgi:sigma-B regulation protein RsbQ
VEIGHELGLKDATFVGHSVSSMIDVLAAANAPGMFGKLVLVGPSARYIDDEDEGYIDGFSASRSRSCCSFSNPTTWDGRSRWRLAGARQRLAVASSNRLGSLRSVFALPSILATPPATASSSGRCLPNI